MRVKRVFWGCTGSASGGKLLCEAVESVIEQGNNFQCLSVSQCLSMLH